MESGYELLSAVRTVVGQRTRIKRDGRKAQRSILKCAAGYDKWTRMTMIYGVGDRFQNLIIFQVRPCNLGTRAE